MQTTQQVGKGTGIFVSPASSGCGLDGTIDVQLLLMKASDDELKDLGQQMKQNNLLKKAYREEIKKYRVLLMRSTVNGNGGTDKTEANNKNVALTTKESKSYKHANGFYFNSNTNEIIEYKTDSFGTLIDNKTKKDKNGNYLIPKENIERMIENLNDEKDNLNSVSETISLQIQSLTNVRKTALETVSNCISKGNEAQSSIIRNMRG